MAGVKISINKEYLLYFLKIDTMDYFWNFIELGILIILVIILIFLIVNRRQYKNNKNISDSWLKNEGNNIEEEHKRQEKERRRREEEERKRREKEIARRKKESNELKAKLDSEFKFQENLLSDLSRDLYWKFEGRPKTYINVSRETNPKLHSELCDMFQLDREEKILYLRRYEITFGSDSFFILTKKGFGYAPNRSPREFLYYEDIKELIERNDYIELRDNNDEPNYMDAEDFTYDWERRDILINLLNQFLSQYRSQLDIFLDAAFEALENKLTPILPDLIEKVGDYHEGWKKILRANYKYLLASEGEDIKYNIREAIDDIIDVKNILKDNKESRIYCMSELLRVKLMLLNNEEDPIEIKKIIDTVAATAKDSDVRDQAAELRRELRL